MSTTSYLLLLLFLCISLHACNARNLSPQDKKLEEKSHFTEKSGEKNGFDSSQKQLNEGNNNKMVANFEKSKNKRSTIHRVFKAMGKGSGLVQSEPDLVSVSWRVPHKQASQKNPGFNVDYSPPKTHPPHHN